jgi:hypothetical protein
MAKTKYNNLTKGFPEDLVEQSLSKLEEGEEEYAEFILEICHSYALTLLSVFWGGIANYAGQFGNYLTLENFDKIQQPVDDDGGETGE